MKFMLSMEIYNIMILFESLRDRKRSHTMFRFPRNEGEGEIRTAMAQFRYQEGKRSGNTEQSKSGRRQFNFLVMLRFFLK